MLNDNEKADEKDRLNVHILIIENMHFFSIELADRQIKTLHSYIVEAKNSFKHHLNEYKKIVIYKTFGKFMVSLKITINKIYCNLKY